MESPDAAITIPILQQMKRDGRKIVGVVAWDYQIAQIVDRVGVDIVSVGDTVGINLWGHSSPLEITMDRLSLRPSPRRYRCSAESGHPDGQRGGRGYDQAGWRGPIS